MATKEVNLNCDGKSSIVGDEWVDVTSYIAKTVETLGVGDYVSFSGAASLGGTVTADVLNQENI